MTPCIAPKAEKVKFRPAKGVDTLIKAFALLPADCVLVLVGDSSERPKLEALAQELGVSARVRWVPWVNSWDVPEYMNAFDVLVLPSRTSWNIKEQFGRVSSRSDGLRNVCCRFGPGGDLKRDRRRGFDFP